MFNLKQWFSSCVQAKAFRKPQAAPGWGSEEVRELLGKAEGGRAAHLYFNQSLSGLHAGILHETSRGGKRKLPLLTVFSHAVTERTVNLTPQGTGHSLRKERTHRSIF